MVRVFNLANLICFSKSDLQISGTKIFANICRLTFCDFIKGTYKTNPTYFIGQYNIRHIYVTDGMQNRSTWSEMSDLVGLK